MAKTILNVVSSSYRATLEEQDDTVLWLTYTMKVNGAQPDVLLRGSCVNYGLNEVSAKKPLEIADWKQTNPPDMHTDLKRMHASGIQIFYLEEDAVALSLQKKELFDFMKPISKEELAKLFAVYDYVWQW
jgi:hypothetical protein